MRRKMYQHLIKTDVFGVASKIKEERKQNRKPNKKNKRK